MPKSKKQKRKQFSVAAIIFGTLLLIISLTFIIYSNTPEKEIGDARTNAYEEGGCQFVGHCLDGLRCVFKDGPYGGRLERGNEICINPSPTPTLSPVTDTRTMCKVEFPTAQGCGGKRVGDQFYDETAKTWFRCTEGTGKTQDPNMPYATAYCGRVIVTVNSGVTPTPFVSQSASPTTRVVAPGSCVVNSHPLCVGLLPGTEVKYGVTTCLVCQNPNNNLVCTLPESSLRTCGDLLTPTLTPTPTVRSYSYAGGCTQLNQCVNGKICKDDGEMVIRPSSVSCSTGTSSITSTSRSTSSSVSGSIGASVNTFQPYTFAGGCQAIGQCVSGRRCQDDGDRVIRPSQVTCTTTAPRQVAQQDSSGPTGTSRSITTQDLQNGNYTVPGSAVVPQTIVQTSAVPPVTVQSSGCNALLCGLNSGTCINNRCIENYRIQEKPQDGLGDINQFLSTSGENCAGEGEDPWGGKPCCAGLNMNSNNRCVSDPSDQCLRAGIPIPANGMICCEGLEMKDNNICEARSVPSSCSFMSQIPLIGNRLEQMCTNFVSGSTGG